MHTLERAVHFLAYPESLGILGIIITIMLQHSGTSSYREELVGGNGRIKRGSDLYLRTLLNHSSWDWQGAMS